MLSDQQLQKLLERHFGFSSFRDGQEETIKAILNQQNTLAVLPTGGGKSLLYQFPAYVLPGAVLIVSPLISLMQDQVDRLHRAGEKRVLMINGQLTGKTRRELLGKLSQFKFIFTSPESLISLDVIKALKRTSISLFVVDEAHCISQWGPDFRPEYLLLNQVRKQLGLPTTLLLTATATPEVRSDILDKMGMKSSEVTSIIRSVNRPNIAYAVQRFLSTNDKSQYLIDLVNSLSGAGIIYFASRKLATQFAEKLDFETNKNVAAYHAGMPAVDRYRLQQQFMSNQVQLICATSAFGMGIDKSDIRFVIHYHQPANLESCVQEVGRAGRDGQSSLALLLYCPGDEQIQQTLNHIDLPSKEILDAVKEKRESTKVLGENQELFSFYLNHGYDGEQLIETFRQRQKSLNYHLNWMARYINNSTICRRTMILDYFGEILKKRPTRCCDIEDSSLIQEFKSSNPEENEKKSVHREINWSRQLRRLFNINPPEEG